MKIRPRGSRVLIRPFDEGEKTSSGGIIIPPTATGQQAPSKATVVSTGPGRRSQTGELIAIHLLKGDVVLYTRHAGTEITVGEDKFLLIDESQIMAELEED